MTDIKRRRMLHLMGIGATVSLVGGPSSAYAQSADREKVFIKPTRGQKERVLNQIPSEARSVREYDNFEFISIEIPKQARRNLENNPNIEYVETDSKIEIIRNNRPNFNVPGQTVRNRRNNPTNTGPPDSIPDGATDDDEDIYTGSEEEEEKEQEKEQDSHCSDSQPPQTIPWGVERINAHNSDYKGKNVDVAVLDTGVESNHCSLSVSGGKNFTDSGDESDYSDKHGHGTHVAGIVSAIDNGYGVKGVAPESNLYALKVLNDDGAGLQSWMASAIDWCISNDIDIINLSIGSPDSTATMDDIISTAYEEGHLIIASAGNNENSGSDYCSESNVTYPATHEDVVSVSAMNKNDELARYSSVGEEVEIMAPGSQILSTHIDNSYVEQSGTSMAAPHVSGVAAQHWEREEDNSGMNKKIREYLKEQAEEILSDSCAEGNGLVMSDKRIEADEDEEEDVPEEPDEDEEEDVPEEPDEEEEEDVPEEPDEEEEEDVPEEPDEEEEEEERNRGPSSGMPGNSSNTPARSRSRSRRIRDLIFSRFR